VSTASATTLHADGARDAHPPQTSGFVTGCCTMNNVFQTHETASRCAMQFSLAEATSYTLAGQLNVSTSGSFELARIRLTGPGGAVIELQELDPDDCDYSGDFSCELDADFSETGVLAPGVYELTAEMNGRPRAPSPSSSRDSTTAHTTSR
jgi:hypothetical protein